MSIGYILVICAMFTDGLRIRINHQHPSDVNDTESIENALVSNGVLISISFEDIIQNDSDMTDIIVILDEMLHQINNHSIDGIWYKSNMHHTNIVSLNITVFFYTNQEQTAFVSVVNNPSFQQQLIRRINSETNLFLLYQQLTIHAHEIAFAEHHLTNTTSAFMSTNIEIINKIRDRTENEQGGIILIAITTISCVIFCYTTWKMIKCIRNVMHPQKDNDAKCKDHIQFNNTQPIIVLQKVVQIPKIVADETLSKKEIIGEFTEFTVTETNNDLYEPGPITPMDDGDIAANELLKYKITVFGQLMKEGDINETKLPRPPPRQQSEELREMNIDEIPEQYPPSVAMSHDVNTHSYPPSNNGLL